MFPLGEGRVSISPYKKVFCFFVRHPRLCRGCLTEKGKIPHDKAIDEMKESDVLLIIQPTLIRKGVYTGKLFGAFCK
jgi:hypothetical protein